MKDKKRALRRHNTNKYIKKQLFIQNKIHHIENQRSSGYYKKISSLDCGISGCICCSNPRRVWNEKTLKEKQADEDFKTQDF